MRKLISITAFALSFAGPVLAEGIPIKFTLDWKIQGVHSWFYLAEEKGYFDAEGLDVTIDQGEGVWIRLGDQDFGVEYENHTSHAGAGQILLYPGGISETEILLAYGGVCFASKMGMLAGNHFITLTSGLENLKTLGNAVLWEGAKEISFELA